MNKKLQSLLTALIFLMGFTSMQAQDLFAKANKQFELGAYDLAINNYQKLLEEDSKNVSAIGSLAEAYFRTQNYMEAIHWYEELGTFEAMEPRHILNYAHLMKSLGLYDKAELWYMKYKNINPPVAEHFIHSCEIAKIYLQEDEKYDISLFNGNSASSDFGVSFYQGNLIYSSFRTDMKRETASRNFSNVHKAGNQLLVCTDKSNANFTNISFLRSDIKDIYNIGALSYAGNEVSYTRNNFADGYKQISGNEGDLNIFFSEVVTDEGDFDKETAFIHNESGSSTAFPTYFNDGNSLIFCSNRDGGSGLFDLYITHKKQGTWTAPVNLGEALNTPGNDITPYVHDNTLYFSSDFHLGIGGYDVFKVTIYEDGTFGVVENMGKGVNSPMDDYYYAVDPTNGKAYFSSNRIGGMGNEDIYVASKLELPVLASSEEITIPQVVNLEELASNTRSLQSKEIARTVAFEETTEKRVENYSPTLSDEATSKAYVVFVESEINEVLPTNDSKNDKKDISLRTDLNNVIVEKTENDIKHLSVNAVDPTTNSITAVAVGIDNSFDLKGALKVAHNELITAASNVYFIQLASLSNSKGSISPFLELSDLGNLYKVHKSGTVKIRIGYFYEEIEATRRLKTVKEQGFRDAFIVYEPLVTSQLELVNTASTKTYYEGDYLPKGEISNYKIRLASYTDPLWFDTGSVKDIGEIEQWTKGDYTIFVLSGYSSIAETEAALIKALNRGYSEAHIVEDINGYLQKVQRN